MALVKYTGADGAQTLGTRPLKSGDVLDVPATEIACLCMTGLFKAVADLDTPSAPSVPATPAPEEPAKDFTAVDDLDDDDDDEDEE